MKIRDAVEADLPTIVRIYNSTIPSRRSTADTEPVTVEQRLAWFRERDWTRRPIWVVEVDEEVAGWLSLGPFYNGRPAYHATAEISVYVSERHRRKSIGRRLVQKAIGCSQTLGLKSLTAGVQGHNEPSIRFFEDLGFERWAHFPGVAELEGKERDLLVMGLRITRSESTLL